MSTPQLRPFIGTPIPASLRAQKRWAPWAGEWVEKKQKFNKKPYRADRPEYGISTQRPEQWFTYDQAVAAYRARPDFFAGVGYVMTGAHGVVGVDLDHCVEAGVVAPWAAEVIAKLDSYTEVSPSGTGLRVLCLGEIPSDWNNHDVGIEVYGGNEARFLTVTGEQLAGSPADVRAPRVGALEGLAVRYAKERRKADVIDLNMPDLVDDMLLEPVEDIGLQASVRDFLLDGRHSGDRSRAVFGAAVALYAAGLNDAEVFSTLAGSAAVMEAALDHRRQDYDRALLYIWREHCCKGKAKAADARPLALDDFDELPEEPPTSRDLGPKPKPYEVQTLEQFAQRRAPSWIIKGVLPRASMAVMFGASGSGKTFFVLDMVMAIALGQDWCGKRTKKGRVVYVCAEGANGFRGRIEAYARHTDTDIADIDLGVIADAPNLMDKEVVKSVVASLRAFGQLDVLVIDTYARVMPGGNENDSKDTGLVVNACEMIHKITGAMVILVHHSGKDVGRGARGSNALRAAADCEIEITRSENYRGATITKMKDGEDGAEMGFQLNTIVLGVDEDGDDITSCVVEHKAVVPKAERKQTPKGANEKRILRYLTDHQAIGLDEMGRAEMLEKLKAELPEPDDKTVKDRRLEYLVRSLKTLVTGNWITDDGFKLALK